VPYKGVAEAYPAVASGLVNWVLGNPLSAVPLMKAGRVKGIAVTGATRMKAMPDLPTVAESGVPGYAVEAWFALFAPARTPMTVVNRLQKEAAKARHGGQLAAGIREGREGRARQVARPRRQGGPQDPIGRSQSTTGSNCEQRMNVERGRMTVGLRPTNTGPSLSLRPVRPGKA
jgi:hypothetical protein